jgi:hypothetical protein
MAYILNTIADISVIIGVVIALYLMIKINNKF